MKILIVHNKYQQPGGEDKVVEAETSLLRDHGNQVITYLKDNKELDRRTAFSIARETIWSSRTYREISILIKENRPDIIHVHNTLAVISPSIYWAASKANVPVVQTLHNFRLSCLNGLYLRENKICQDCKGKTPWRGVTRKCYRDSLPASIVLATSLVIHRILGTYRNHVARYISLTHFSKHQFIEGGIPEEKIVVKPNFVDFQEPKLQERSDFLFVGRLSSEKGLQCLADAARTCPEITIRVAGTGPNQSMLRGIKNISLLGVLSQQKIFEEMRKSIALLLPSICLETFGMVTIESAAAETPVIGSRLGATKELIENDKTGLLFTTGDAQELARKIKWASHHKEEMRIMGHNARKTYQRKWTAQKNYLSLIRIYKDAISSHQK